MSHIKLIRGKHGLCLDDNTSETLLTHLYYFLNGDCGGSRGAQSWNEWLYDDSAQRAMFSNYSALVKTDNYVLIGCTFDFEGVDAFHETALTVSLRSFSRLLNEWGKICLEKPDEITIYLDGKELSIEWAFVH